VILDFFNLKRIKTKDEIEALRLNEIAIKEMVDFQKLDNYKLMFNSKVLNQRIKMLKEVINA